MSNFLSQYEQHDTDPELGLVSYINSCGEWVIVQTTATARRFAVGTENYALHWANRANLEYVLLPVAISNPLK